MKAACKWGLLVLIILFSSSTLFAAENAEKEEGKDEPKKAREVVVTATRTETDTHDSPSPATVLDSDELLREKAVRNMPEALADEPSVMVQKTGHGMGSPYIRGFTGYHNLLMMDGIRVNNSVFRSGPNQYWTLVDVFSIDRLEIVRGAGSVLYGSDALGGVVNAITREASLKDPLGAKTYYRRSSAEQSHIMRGEGAGAGKDFSVLAGITYKDFGDLICGKHVGEQPGSGYQIAFGDVKLVKWLSKNEKITMAYYLANQNDSPRTHKTQDIISWRGTDTGSDVMREYDQDRRMGYLSYHKNKLGGFADEVKITLSYQNMSEEMRRIKGSSPDEMRHIGFDVDTYGFQVELKTKTSFGELTYGFDFYRDSVYTSEIRRDLTTSDVTSVKPRGKYADDSFYALAGVYAQDKITMGEKLELFLGARYNYAALDAGIVDPDDPTAADAFESFTSTYDSVVGSVKALYKATDETNLVIGVSQGFRAPNLSDTTAFESTGSGMDVPNPDLDPEKSLSIDLGVKYKSKKARAQAFVYQTMLSDFLRRVPTTYKGETHVDPSDNTSDVYTMMENFASGYVRGVELAGKYQLDNSWSVSGSWTWQQGEGDWFIAANGSYIDGGEKVELPLTRIAPARTVLGVRYDHPGEGFWTEFYTVIAARQDELSPSDENDTSRIPPGGTPGYVTYNLRGGIKMSEYMSAFFGVENITDVDYRVHGSGINAPGTNFVFALDMKF